MSEDTDLLLDKPFSRTLSVTVRSVVFDPFRVEVSLIGHILTCYGYFEPPLRHLSELYGNWCESLSAKTREGERIRMNLRIRLDEPIFQHVVISGPFPCRASLMELRAPLASPLALLKQFGYLAEPSQCMAEPVPTLAEPAPNLVTPFGRIRPLCEVEHAPCPEFLRPLPKLVETDPNLVQAIATRVHRTPSLLSSPRQQWSNLLAFL